MQQEVLFADDIKNPLGRLQRGGQCGREGREFQVGAVNEVVEAHQPHEIERARQAEDVFVGKAEMIAKRREGPVVHAPLNFEAHRGAATKVPQLLLDLLEQVLRLFLVDVEIAVPGDAEGVRAVNAIAGKELAGAKLDDLAKKDVPLRPVPGGLDPNQPRQDARHRQDGHEAHHVGNLGVVE